MTMWNDRLLPHPLLAPWTDDYPDGAFSVQVPHAVLSSGTQINLTIQYSLTSGTLNDLITAGQAIYTSVLACPKTLSRTSHPSREHQDILVLNAHDYVEEIQLTPYVTATQPLSSFASLEHSQELKAIKPDGFYIPIGSILAIGESVKIELEQGGSPYSVIDLVADPSIARGEFRVGLEDNRIKIFVHIEDKQRIEALRQHGENTREKAVLFPSVYLHAVVEALRNYSNHSDRRWSQTLRQALERHGKNPDDHEDVQSSALVHAQTLMQKPVGTFLSAFTRQEEE